MEQAGAPVERRVSHYRILRPLGAGGMGEVYAAFDETLKRRVALKSIRSEHRFKAESKARFIREARILSQLDHPHVCRIHDYVEDSDSDWLVLEFIEGVNLHELIARGLNSARKLRIAEQIADVLVATHAAGVVHRDLKPANVMVTPAGDVKVLDFGLSHPVSRFVTSPSSAGAAIAIAPGTQSGNEEATRTVQLAADIGRVLSPDDQQSIFRTRGGALSGTVAYMSPEQAKDLSATTASDMYSFGLLLQELFTDRPPYHQGLDLAGLLDCATRADTPPPTGVAPDLTALILRLKSAAPSQRPTAVEALERLRWIRDKPARRLRRAVAAALVLAALLGAAKYTADLAHERAVAVAARNEADQRRRQAESLIGFMLGDLRTKLQQVGRLDLLEEVGREATAYFRAVPDNALSDEELYRRSQALYQIGQVHQAKGSLPQASEAFRESLALVTKVAARAPENNDWQLGLGTAHFYLGDALRRQGDLDGALEHFRSYWQIAERLLARAPDNPAWRLEASFGHSNVAAVLEAKGDLRGALAELETTLALKQQVSTSDPGNAEWRRTLASTHNRLGVVLQKLGRLAEARDHHRRNLDLQQALLNEAPANAQLQRGVGIAHGWLGNVLDDLGEVAEAMPHHTARHAIASALVAQDPANADWLREQAVARMRLAMVKSENRQFDVAEAMYRESIATVEGLLQKGQRVALQRDVATGHTGLARLLLSRGRASAAEASARHCATALAPLVASATPDPDIAADAVTCELLLGRALAAQQRRAEANAQWQRALQAVTALARSSENPAIRALEARALLNLGRGPEAEALVDKILLTGYRNRWLLEDLAHLKPRR
jgi:eukaryotic-like serine/threonine-protein kinase